eukprot:s157_g39.t1
MALSKPLASWRTWWSKTDVVPKVAETLYQTMDPTRLPGNGKLVQLKVAARVTPADLDDPHTSKIVEGLLEAYPAEKEPSGYCLGDAVMSLNSLMGDTLIGPMKANPIDEKEFQDAGCLPPTSLEEAFGHASDEADAVPIQNVENENDGDPVIVEPSVDDGIKKPMEFDAKKPKKVALKRAVAAAEAQAAEASEPCPKKAKVESEQLPVPDGQGL